MKKLFALLLLSGIALHGQGQKRMPHYRLPPVPAANVTLTDSFWKPRIETAFHEGFDWVTLHFDPNNGGYRTFRESQRRDTVKVALLLSFSFLLAAFEDADLLPFSAMLADPLFRDVLDFYAATERKTDDRDLLAGEIATRAEALATRGLLLRDDPTKPFRKRFLLTLKPEMARVMARFAASDSARRLAARLAALGIDPKPAEAEAPQGNALAGKSVVITGTLSQPREAFERLIRQNGGTVQGAVSKKTAFLLAGANPGGSKWDKAQTLGTPVLDEAAFLALLGGQPPPPPSPKPKAAPAYEQGDLFGGLA